MSEILQPPQSFPSLFSQTLFLSTLLESHLLEPLWLPINQHIICECLEGAACAVMLLSCKFIKDLQGFCVYFISQTLNKMFFFTKVVETTGQRGELSNYYLTLENLTPLKYNAASPYLIFTQDLAHPFPLNPFLQVSGMFVSPCFWKD